MIIYKSGAELESMRQGGRILATVFRELRPLIQPGLRTRDLDLYAESRTRELGGIPAQKGYCGYPASLCVSVNEEVVHGIPSGRVLEEGDIVSVDYSVQFERMFTDAAMTVPVGKVSEKAKRLIETAENSLYIGINQMRTGAHLMDISYAIQQAVEKEGFSVIRQFVGHGIGRALHEEPQVPNYGTPGRGPKLKPGIVLAIEPMISAGDWEVEVMEDGWTAVTIDRSIAAHAEHTVALTENGWEILTGWDGRPAKEAGTIPEEDGVHG